MTLICLGVQGKYPTGDLTSFWHECLVASEANFGLWSLLLGLSEYFQNSSQTIHNYAIPIQFWPMVAAPVLDHYFIGLMVPGLWPLPETSDSPYHASNMPMCVMGVPQKWIEIILTRWSDGLRGQLWPLASLDGSAWIFSKSIHNDTISKPFGPLGAVLAFDDYFWGQLWPLVSFEGSAWIFPKNIPNHP